MPMAAALLALCAGAVQVPCESGVPGDTKVEKCAVWCKVEKVTNHCKACKCAGCMFCKGQPKPSAKAGETAMVERKRRIDSASGAAAQPAAALPQSTQPPQPQPPLAAALPPATEPCAAAARRAPRRSRCGCRAHGSTWVQDALDSHPEITMAGEVRAAARPPTSEGSHAADRATATRPLADLQQLERQRAVHGADVRVLHETTRRRFGRVRGSSRSSSRATPISTTSCAHTRRRHGASRRSTAACGRRARRRPPG